MKCIVLAGGAGDRLWPLSRRNFPNQFIELKQGMRIFQETILRNIPFCERFIIVTNALYKNTALNQLRVFQGLNYTLVLEPAPLKTAPALVKICQNLNPEEEVLIVSCDCLIEGDYNSDLVEAKAKLDQDKVVAVAVEQKEDAKGFHFFKIENNNVSFDFSYKEGSLIDCGIFLSKVKVFLDAIDKNYLAKCDSISIVNNVLVCPNEKAIALRLNEVLNPSSLLVSKGSFKYSAVVDLSSLYRYLDNNEIDNPNTIIEGCKNVEVINNTKDRLVVVNDLENVVVANTKDAVYITNKNSEWANKEIGKKTLESKKFFETTPKVYFSWGVSERLDKTDHTKINKLVIYPDAEAKMMYQPGHIYNYVVSSGEITVVNNDESITYKKNESFTISGKNRFAKLRNETAVHTRLIQIIDRVDDEIEKSDGACFVRMQPVFQDYIWGGTKIRDVLDKDIGTFDTVAESWELSAHKDGQSIISNGPYRGMRFSKYLKKIGKENLGWKIQNYERFPLMIKFIDASRNLSIQVHPQDEYSFKKENDYGKNEMWYIMEAEEGAFIYIGFKKDITRAEIEERIANNTLEQVLNKIYVKPGESYYIEAGTVHAIGAGCLVCEVQQSSNVTYRLYDYGRLEKDGTPRKLHIDKALDVIDLNKKDVSAIQGGNIISNDDYDEVSLAECKYFSVSKFEVKKDLSLPATDSSFKAIVVVDGEGTISNGTTTRHTYKGDTWFAGCKEVVTLKGNMTILVANV